MTNQRVDDWGRVVLDEKGLLELFYKGDAQTHDLLVEDNDVMRKYNTWCKTFDKTEKQLPVYEPLAVSPEEFHASRQSEWLMYPEFSEIDVESWLLAKCSTSVQIERVNMELELYKRYNMVDVLRLLIYITDTLKQNGVWWGVGRGSSVASYCLYLIGVHKIDSIKYDLDIREFIKDIKC